METFSALLAICAGNSPVTGEFPAQRPVTRSFDVFFDLNKRLSKHSWGWWFETPLWRHCNVNAQGLSKTDELPATTQHNEAQTEYIIPWMYSKYIQLTLMVPVLRDQAKYVFDYFIVYTLNAVWCALNCIENVCTHKSIPESISFSIKIPSW